MSVDRPGGHESPSTGQNAETRTPVIAAINATALGPSMLIKLCEEIYSSFNPAPVTLDSHLDSCIAQHRITAEDDQKFIRQVVYGVYRYRRMLSVLMDSFFHFNSGTALRKDRDLYMVFGYLTLFRLDELKVNQYRQLVESQDPQKMIVFLRYLFNQQYLEEVCREDWLTLYDKEFVDDMVARLLGWQPQLEKLMLELEHIVYVTQSKKEEHDAQKAVVVEKPKAFTSPEPFNLSQPKPKPMPQEELKPPPVKCNPPPKRREGPTKEELAIAAAKEANKEVIKAKYSKPHKQPFKLRVLERPMHLDKLREEAELLKAKAHEYYPPKARMPMAYPPVEVKLTAATIMREDALYRKKQEQEAQMVQAYEAALRDTKEHDQWQQKMLELDEEAKKAEIERRRAEMAASHEAAIQARHTQVQSNLELGRQMKEERAKLEEDLQKGRQDDIARKQASREAVIADRVKIDQALERLTMEKRLAAEEERLKQQADAKLLAEAAAREMAERKDIIMQLRALERAPRQKAKEFDPTDVVDHGLLDQLSLVELRARLEFVKAVQKEEEERMRQKIAKSKEEREQTLQGKVSNIQRIRKLAAAQAHVRREYKTQDRIERERLAKEHLERTMRLLDQKLKAKKAVMEVEKQRLAAEEKQTMFEKFQDDVEAAAAEELRLRELATGAPKVHVSTRQAAQMANMDAITKARMKREHKKFCKLKYKTKKDFLRAYDEKLEQLEVEAAAARAQDCTHRSKLAEKQRDQEAVLRAEREANAYKPFSNSSTTMQSRLQGLAQGIEVD